MVHKNGLLRRKVKSQEVSFSNDATELPGLCLPELKNYLQLPHQEMRNLYIDTGYRVGYSFSHCMRSLFTFHNETMNIWSHLISLIALIVVSLISSLKSEYIH
jgi:hypothetical protein